MPASDSIRERLRAITTFPALIAYLRDELGWPIETEHFDDLYFDYEPEELGLDSEIATRIESIKQLRPLDSVQPWGIFFIEFERKRLPVVALRRILRSLVIKKRQSANRSEQATWHASDLLFISTYGESDERQISFAHFYESPEKSDLPTLRVLGWDNADTPLHLDHVHRELTEKLRWPDDSTVPDRWRETWSSAFTLRHREVITTSKQLAVRLAELARVIRQRTNAVLAVETEKGSIRRLMAAFRESLIHDLEDDDFADMYAQTIAYGLLTARMSRPAGLVAENVSDMVPITNPFLKELLQTFLSIGGRKSLIDFDELGVNDVVEMLRDANMEAVLRDFGDRNPDEDPVIHFYERFLTEYDKKKKMQRGVFYTPLPVVSFIVRSVDEILRTEFGLEDGLADTSTWGEMLKLHPEMRLPENASKYDSFVQIIDPAAGTGTFLVEVIDVIHKTMRAKWKAMGHLELEFPMLWDDYVPKHLLRRLYGFELMMAPFAIAHMKIGLKLLETGYRFASDERARVYLTNSLEEPCDFSAQLVLMAPELAREAAAANKVKGEVPITVVIGNPPYSKSSFNTNEYIDSLMEAYKTTVRDEESQIQSLSNDYIKFIRFGERMVSQVGILGMITGHGYLYGTQPRDMRHHLLQTFDTIRCLDLHGSVRRASTDDRLDEPVFEIMTGVAIMIAERTSARAMNSVVCTSNLTGTRDSKFAYLARESVRGASFHWAESHPEPPNYSFVASGGNDGVEAEYNLRPDICKVFGTGNRAKDKEQFWATGFASQQDELAIAFSREELVDQIADLASARSQTELNRRYRLCTTNQWDFTKARAFAKQEKWLPHVRKVAYRPFDRRWTAYHKHILTITRLRVMGQFTLDQSGRYNIALVVSRAINDRRFAHCFVTREPTDKIFLSSKTSTNAYVFPLYRRSALDESCQGQMILGDTQLESNVSPAFAESIAALLRLRWLGEGCGDLQKTVGPEDLLHYVYSQFYSPGYRDRYAECLKMDFPRVFLTEDLDLFRRMCQFGADLVALHLLEDDYPAASWHNIGTTNGPLVGPITAFASCGGLTVDKGQPKYREGSVFINAASHFEDVPEDVWNFHIGGYQVCEKWLKDRRGRVLSEEDIAHYQKIVVALNETIRLMAEIDNVIEEHGGWPGAFVIDQ